MSAAATVPLGSLPMDSLDDARVDLSLRYRNVRERTIRLAAPLSPEDCAVQSMEEASPVKWHLAHTSWFFENFVLEPAMPGYRPYHAEYRYLFNSYYHSMGARYPRPQRGLLTRPSLEEVLAYRRHVDHHVVALLAKGPDLDPERRASIELGLHHEQQHQELALTDVQHVLSHNPLHPAYCDAPEPAPVEPSPHAWHPYAEGLRWIGHEGRGFAFDCERPRHRVFVEAFALGSRLVTNAEYLAFAEDGGYERPELWLSDGWSVRQSRDWSAPLYWETRDGCRFVFTLAGLRRLRPEEPVCHVSYYEADAYARWTDARLPTEAEWESAAAAASSEGNFVESGRFHPAPAEPGTQGPSQLFGDVWEWTGSPFAPYPGYRPPPGPVGEYNGKFMCNQITLRGGSCATPRSHIRPTYRNFFFPDARWQFSGIRLARDAG
ncbi:MAG: ergothioneine biosynthesis protein EgtB [Myxococcales bacterium]|nr:ergothioneine biosynthesis protein EgtB [Myxococcales bacterium]